MKKMDLIKRYQESGDIQEILDRINEKYGYKITKDGVGDVIEQELTEESRLEEFEKDDDMTEDAFLKKLNSLIYGVYIDNSDNRELRRYNEDDFKESLPYIIGRMRSEIKTLLELCPEASEK